jgi:hypothetical protein
VKLRAAFEAGRAAGLAERNPFEELFGNTLKR